MVASGARLVPTRGHAAHVRDAGARRRRVARWPRSPVRVECVALVGHRDRGTARGRIPRTKVPAFDSELDVGAHLGALDQRRGHAPPRCAHVHGGTSDHRLRPAGCLRERARGGDRWCDPSTTHRDEAADLTTVGPQRQGAPWVCTAPRVAARLGRRVVSRAPLSPADVHARNSVARVPDRLQCQTVFKADGATVARVDFYFRTASVVVEVSGRRGHTSDADRRRDARRRNRLQETSVVVEFTTADVIDDPAYVLATLRRHLHVRGRSVGSAVKAAT